MSRRNRREAALPIVQYEETREAREARELEEKITEYIARQHFRPVWVDLDFLTRSGLRERVTEMLRVSGWTALLHMWCAADVNDTSEFLATFGYIGRREEEGFTYRHRGVRYNCTMRELREVFRWRRHSRETGGTWEPYQGLYNPYWREIATDPYNEGQSKARSLREPALYYLHHILSKTIFARKNADKIGRLELRVLYMLHIGRDIHWGHYWCKHLDTLRVNSTLSCGGMITHFLRTRHPGDVPEHHSILHGEVADDVWFSSGRNIQITHEGRIEWIYFTDPSLRPPPVVPRPRGRPRRQRDALVVREEEEENQPQQPQQPQQSQQPPQQGPDVLRQMVDMFFNSTRSSLLGGRQLPFVPAPPGWQPGQPIPPEFL